MMEEDVVALWEDVSPLYHISVGVYHSDAQVEAGIRRGSLYYLWVCEYVEIDYHPAVGWYFPLTAPAA